MNLPPMRIGVRIKLARVKRGVTQAELAHLTELSQAYLSQIETGDRTPGTETVEAICQALGCNLDGDDW